MDVEAIQTASMELIAFGGEAFSCFHEAIAHARTGRLEDAQASMEEGRRAIASAHEVQIDLLAAEGRGEDMAFSLLLVHSQDHLMSAMMFENVAREFIELYSERAEGRGDNE